MIARIIIPLILAIVLLDLYYDVRWLRHHRLYRWWCRLLWWMPGIVMIAWGLWLALQPDFIPDDISIVNWYLLLLGMVALPKAVAAFCSLLGKLIRRLFHSRCPWGRWLAVPACILTWVAVVYGSTAGVSQLEVRHIDLEFDNLPDGYDGYRILHFSDAHLGSFNGWRHKLLVRTIDSINAQKADLIAFTGDIQNIKPAELHAFSAEMSRLKATDGVVSVLGNHDYSWYTREDSLTEARWRQQTVDIQKQWGWRLLRNENIALRRGQDSLMVMGEENLLKPDEARLQTASKGIGAAAFVIYLQHHPAGWRSHAVGDSRYALTLSGHTHGGQVSVLGFSPVSLAYSEGYGLYREGSQWLYVTSGIGALLPFRLGMPAEIAVITLHKRKL